MEQPAPNSKIRAARFMGKPKENLDSYIGQFETRWQESGFERMYGDDIKKEQLAFVDKATN